MQTRIQRCHPRGKSWRHWPVMHSTRNFSMEQKSLKRKSFKHKLKDLQKENAYFLEADPRNSRVSGHCGGAFQKSELKFWALQQTYTGSRTAESTHTGDDAVSLSQEHLEPCLHRWLCRERCLGVEVEMPTSITQMEPSPPSPCQLVTWAPTTEQKFTPWKLPQNTWLGNNTTNRILSCSLIPCLLFSLSQMAPLTFTPNSYTTACVLCQTTTE